MGRLTKFGHQKLLGEYEELLYKKRPVVVKKIADAAAEGDRSENAEYIYGKKNLREIDKRLAYLSSLLKDVSILDQVQDDKIIFGSLVTVLDEMGQERVYRIVGEGETDFYEQAVSEKSPMAKALLGRRVGDFIEVKRPKGLLELEVLKIA